MSEAVGNSAVQATSDPAPQHDAGERQGVADRWQIPLLVIGMATFGGGLARMVGSYQPVSFEEQMLVATRLVEEGRLDAAGAYLQGLLAESDLTANKQAVVHATLADAIYRAEARLTSHSRHNAEAILSNVRAALKDGYRLNGAESAMAGDAHAWCGENDEAAKAFREALKESVPRPGEVRRRLVDVLMRGDGTLPDDALAEMDRLMDEPNGSEEEAFWAMRRRVEWLLDRDDVDGAQAVLAAHRERFESGASATGVLCLEARCLAEAGRREEAEQLARRARNQCPEHNEVWAELGRLLGSLAQAAGRSEEALAFYDEVLGAFDRGALGQACALGRAECLADLRRDDEAIETFDGLARDLARKGRRPFIDRRAMRVTLMAHGESLLNRPDTAPGDFAHAIDYLQLALSMTDASDGDARAACLERIAAAQAALAQRAVTEGVDPKDPNRAIRLFEDAASTLIGLSRQRAEDEAGSADALWRAVANYERAGRSDRVIELLERFATERPLSPLRSKVLFELGQTYQASGMFKAAARTYQAVIEGYLPLPNGLASIVPLAQCLLKGDGADVERGVNLLLDIVDDRGARTLFTPKAREYRQALLLLADHYLHADERAMPDHLERAIERLEDARALYPDDPRMPELSFQLADSYRQSGRGMRNAAGEKGRGGEGEKGRKGEGPAPVGGGDKAETTASRPGEGEAARRVEAALGLYEETIRTLAPQDESALGDVERTYLRLSYLYRGDCLFDLGRYDAAVSAYEEVAWRYGNRPAAVSASMQIYHCYLRAGRMADAAATLGRLRWMIATIPEDAFAAEAGMPPKAYWEQTVQRLEQLGVNEQQVAGL